MKTDEQIAEDIFEGMVPWFSRAIARAFAAELNRPDPDHIEARLRAVFHAEAAEERKRREWRGC